MNDYQTIMDILDRANIAYQRDVDVIAQHLAEPDPPTGSIAIIIESPAQPIPGGFMFNRHTNTELVFGPDRDLIAIWAWE